MYQKTVYQVQALVEHQNNYLKIDHISNLFPF